jgi:hypothetical protein
VSNHRATHARSVAREAGERTYLASVPPAEEVYGAGIERGLWQTDEHATCHDARVVVRYLSPPETRQRKN